MKHVKKHFRYFRYFPFSIQALQKLKPIFKFVVYVKNITNKMANEIQQIFDKFKYYDTEYHDLIKKCTDVRKRRQKYLDMLLNQSDTFLEQHSCKRVNKKIYKQLSHKLILNSLEVFFQNKKDAEKLMSFILKNRDLQTIQNIIHI